MLAVASLGGALAGCASAPPEYTPHETLDEQTGATITTVDKPLVFARDRSERAANLRDYVTIAAAAVNRGGKRELVLVTYIWSTLDPRYEPARADADALVLVADDRRIRLTANGKTPQELGIGSSVDVPAGQSVKPLVFPTDLETLRFLAAARSLQIQTRLADESVSYDLWEDQRPAMDRFVRFLGGER
jgi:hypothetical protein